ncbi:MAG TPA: bifunctional riboflavin kinase/FAD synthetase [Candidatus Hydrogenedentes bacterium]|mgnify:CR=1 FL=1|nr:bifunctional riboflavin kinase/FAD synthetase [Candidatus Hydrogenedentota bacterium]HPG68047.1 bifunctional riboflavin kinase/FAD synthetase [Candidatus Hydrogenedentota bacterium]
MKIIENIRETEFAFPHTVLTIGSFDGVHRGHRRVLDDVVHLARERNGTAAVLTMRPHPREFFSPDHAPNLLTCDRKKTQLLKEAGVDAVLLLQFTAEVANLDRAAFVDHIIRRCCHAEAVVVGHDFRFGRDALGDFEFLQSLGQVYDFVVHQVPPLYVQGERVSSTLIREQVLQGDIEKAALLLGRKYSLVGRVVAGRGIGTELGFPTANIEPRHSAVPAQGVYAGEALVNGQRIPAAINVGIAPTIRQKDLVVEAFLLDFDQNLRDAEIEIVFHRRLRSEKKFPTHAALTEQIAHDVEAVRACLARREDPETGKEALCDT